MIKQRGDFSTIFFEGMICFICLFLFLTGCNVISRYSTSFADWYVEHIFPLWVETYGRITGLFSFSVGEWLLYGFVLLLIITVIDLLGCGIHFLFRRKRIGIARKRFFRAVAWLCLVVYAIMTLNCLLLYRATPFSEKILSEDTRREYTVQELTNLRNTLVKEANRLSKLVERDADGYIVHAGDRKEMAIEQMQKLGEQYTQLAGFYPRPKGLFFSGFFSQQYILGYYFPFSMEANYNTEMYIVNEPVTFCHELSHLKGVLFEDDANFVSFLACIESDDVFFKYSAILSVLTYVDRDFYDSIGKNREKYLEQPRMEAQVLEDDMFLTPEAWERVEEHAVLDTEVVAKASQTFLDANLTMNGVEDGIASYGNVVWLLLRYYNKMNDSSVGSNGMESLKNGYDCLCTADKRGF